MSKIKGTYIILSPIVSFIGIDSLIATNSTYLDYRTYKIIGENCRVIEKINRIQAYLKDMQYEIFFACSDNEDDKELLALAKESILINKHDYNSKTC